MFRTAVGGSRTGTPVAGGEWQLFTLWCHELSMFYAQLMDWGERKELLIHIPYTIRRVDAERAIGILGHFLVRVFGVRFKLIEVQGPRVVEVVGPELRDRLTERGT